MPIDETPPDSPQLEMQASQLNPISSWEQSISPVDPIAAANKAGQDLRGILGTPYQAEQSLQHVQDPFGLESVLGPPQPQKPRTLSAEEAREQYGVPGFLTYDKPVTEDVAQQDNLVARHQQWQALIGQYAPASLPAALGGMVLGAITDPTNDVLALSGIGELAATGIFGEATEAAAGAADLTGGMSRIGKLVRGVPTALGRTAVENVPFVAKDAALAYASGHPDDFDMGQELATVAAFGVLHAGLHAGATALGWLPKRTPGEPPEAARGEEGAGVPPPPPPAAEASPAARAAAMEREAAPTPGQAPGEVGELHAAPEPEQGNVPPDVQALARQIDPETFHEFDSLNAENALHRDALVKLGGDRANLAEAVDAQATIDRINAMTGRRFANQREALADAQATLARVTSTDSPQMAQVRQTLLQNLGRMNELAPAVSAATREAQQIAEGGWNYSASPGGMGRPPEVDRATATERIGTLALGIDNVRKGGGADVGAMLAAALEQRGAGSTEGLVGGEGPDMAPLTDGEQAMTDAARMGPGHVAALASEDPAVRAEAAQALFGRSPRKLWGEEPLDESGRITPAGERRIEMAVAARAYGDLDLVEQLYSAAGKILGGAGRALREVAPAWSAMREAMDRGDAPRGLDMTPHLVAATQLLKASREALPVADQADSFLQTQLEHRMFEGGAISEETEAILRAYFRNEELTQPTAGAKVAKVLKQYADWAASQREESGRGEERNADAGSARLQALYRKHLRGWDGRAGIERAPGRSSGEGGAAGGAGDGVRQPGAGGGEPGSGGVPGEDSVGAADGSEGATVISGAPERGGGDDAGPGGAGSALPGEPGGEPAAGADEGRADAAAAAGRGVDEGQVQANPATAGQVIEADPALRKLRQDLENYVRQSGGTWAPDYEAGRDPATIAEAVRAMNVCLKAEL